jgi:hypothetical protein
LRYVLRQLAQPASAAHGASRWHTAVRRQRRPRPAGVRREQHDRDRVRQLSGPANE